MKFTGFSLHISNPEVTIPFYLDILGFDLVNESIQGNKTIFTIRNAQQSHTLDLVYDSENSEGVYTQYPDDNYWKFSLFVGDILRTQQQLNSNKHTTKEAYQFGQIGYLMHTADLERHQVEFIQKTFKENTKAIAPDNTYFLKEQPILGLLTIRTKDPIQSIRFFEGVLDLKLLVRMYVNRGKGFTLYFLGDKDLVAPNPAIDAIENREWMYQQNELFIEIQYYWESEYDDSFKLNQNSKGLQTINFTGDTTILKTKLSKQNIRFEENDKSITFKSIDDHTIVVRKTTTNVVY